MDWGTSGRKCRRWDKTFQGQKETVLRLPLERHLSSMKNWCRIVEELSRPQCPTREGKLMDCLIDLCKLKAGKGICFASLSGSCTLFSTIVCHCCHSRRQQYQQMLSLHIRICSTLHEKECRFFSVLKNQWIKKIGVYLHVHNIVYPTLRGIAMLPLLLPRAVAAVLLAPPSAKEEISVV